MRRVQSANRRNCLTQWSRLPIRCPSIGIAASIAPVGKGDPLPFHGRALRSPLSTNGDSLDSAGRMAMSTLTRPISAAATLKVRAVEIAGTTTSCGVWSSPDDMFEVVTLSVPPSTRRPRGRSSSSSTASPGCGRDRLFRSPTWGQGVIELHATQDGWDLAALLVMCSIASL